MSGYAKVMTKSHIRANEREYTFTPTKRRTAGTYGVVMCHGAGAPTEFSDTVLTGGMQIGPQLALAGIPSIAAEMGGNQWGNDLAMGCIDTAITYMAAQASVPATKVCLLGVSMGGLTAIRYAMLHPDKVAAVVGIIPLTNLVGFYNANAGSQAEIAAAWGVATGAALPAAADIQSQAASLTVPTRIYYSSADTTVIPADTTAFATAAGVPAIDVGAHGHSDTTLLDVIAQGGGNLAEVANFFKQNGA